MEKDFPTMCWLKSCCGDLVSEKKIRTSKFVCFEMGDISEVGASFTYLYLFFLLCNMSKQILSHRNHNHKFLKVNFFQTKYLDKPARLRFSVFVKGNHYNYKSD